MPFYSVSETKNAHFMGEMDDLGIKLAKQSYWWPSVEDSIHLW